MINKQKKKKVIKIFEIAIHPISLNFGERGLKPPQPPNTTLFYANFNLFVLSRLLQSVTALNIRGDDKNVIVFLFFIQEYYYYYFIGY